MHKLGLRYLGNSFFEIITEGRVRLYIDPHVQGNELCPVKLQELERPDLILVTHGAKDHFGDTPELLRKFKCPVVCDPGVAHYLRNQKFRADQIILMVWGMVWPFQGLKIRAVETRHISFLQDGTSAITGLSLGFIITTESGFNLYHSGDTSIFSDLKLFGKLYHPHLGCILVGNYPGALAELSPEEAALVAKWLGLKWVIPMHYEKGSSEPDRFKKALKHLSPKTKILVLKPGEWQYFSRR